METINQPKHVLITGATGGLGREACELALEWGYHVTAIGRNQVKLLELAKLGCSTFNIDLTILTTEIMPKTDYAAEQQIEDFNSLLKNVDTIWHCAARASPWGDYADFYSDNVLVTRELAKLAAESNCEHQGVKKFVHISSPSVYFDFHHHGYGSEIEEQYQPSKYANHYANTKAQAEACIIKASSKYPQVNFVILRPRAIFGRYDQVLLPRLMRLLQKNSRLPLPRGGQALMDFTYAGNVVHAMQCATLNDDLPTASVFNITNHQPITLAELIEQVFVVELGMSVKILSLPYLVLDKVALALETIAGFRKQEPVFTRYSIGAVNFDMVLDNTQAIEVLGYRPPISMNEGIILTTKHLKDSNLEAI